MADTAGARSGLAYACKTCDSMKRKASPGGVYTDHTYVNGALSNDKTAKKEGINEFLKLINARINAGGGAVCVHLKEPHKLGQFDQQIDDKMMNLIPDDSLFAQNFERHFVDDHHVIYRITQRERVHLSTLDFKTKQPMNRGLSDLTHGQMLQLMTGNVLQQAPQQETDVPKFEKGQEVKLKTGIFQESISLQAKSVKPALAQPGPERSLEALAGYCLKGTSRPLSHYISAFTKLLKGGSIYFGLSEEKEDQAGQEKATGRFICDGVFLESAEKQKQLKDTIMRGIRSEMLVIPLQALDTGDISDVVDVHFHPVSGEPDLFVMEVRVKYMPGVACFDFEGPESYNLQKLDGFMIRLKWVDTFRKRTAILTQK